ncbi:leucine-rich repeat protein [Skeletonema marinoi]|uniref:Leucine-rich repeat protein n=1 Tax=Skeletonema marinoi TaxID=267567 RepID=A0AAD9DHI7_9STRA|nr:leucine-rich repeat protein [Skeletonema marinoi]
MDSDNDSSSDHSEASLGEDEEWLAELQRIRENSYYTTDLDARGSHSYIQNMTDEDWEELGRDISNSTRLVSLNTGAGALNDHKMASLFRDLTESSSIRIMELYDNGLSVVGVRSMVPFLQHANNLTKLDLSHNNFQSEGFNVLFRALRDSPIKILYCASCGIDSIEIDANFIPPNLIWLYLRQNSISTDGCRELAKLLQGEDATLTQLHLERNKIDDDGVEILVDVLRNNKSLTTLDLLENDGISDQGQIQLLKLVNDISCIKATLQSNHTLRKLHVKYDTDPSNELELGEIIQGQIAIATGINERSGSDTKLAGREKVIHTQLNSERRAQLCRQQGVDHSVFSDIDPLHLPEVLSLIARRNGQGELYVALSSTIIALFSTMNRERCIQLRREYHAAIAARHRAIAAEHETKVEELDNELATIKETTLAIAASEVRSQNNVHSQSNKRRRT